MTQEAGSNAPPIVFTARPELRVAVIEELKSLGFAEPVVPGGVEPCIEALIRMPAAILVVDWELGPVDVNQVLGAIKGHFLVETRPIFLVTLELTDAAIAVGAEYGVSQIHAGPISRLTIRECLDALVHEESTTVAIRETLIQVADFRSRGEWHIATPLLMELWDKMPGQERVATELAENLIHDGSWEKALKILEPLGAKDPPSIRALHLHGRCLMAKGDYEGATNLLGRAKILNPHNIDRLLDLGNAFLNNDQVNEAMKSFAEVTALAPDNKEARVGTGQCLLMNGEVNEALALLKAVSGPREMASIFNSAAVLTIRAERFDKGMALYKSAMAALGKDDRIASRLLFNMGLGYKRWSKPEQALACFTRSLGLDPSFGKAQRHKQALEKAGTQMPKAAPAAKPHDNVFAEEELGGPRSRKAPEVESDPGLEDLAIDGLDVDE
jgi:Flp pilus assembly protein TadD